MPQKSSNVVFAVTVTCYFIAVVFSFLRVYVFHAYPVYYSEDDMPSETELLSDIPALLQR